MGCPCQQHATYGEHLRAKRISVGYARSATGGLDLSAEKRHQRELDLYAAARKQGIQPMRTRTKEIHQALDVSDRLGRAAQPGDLNG